MLKLFGYYITNYFLFNNFFLKKSQNKQACIQSNQVVQSKQDEMTNEITHIQNIAKTQFIKNPNRTKSIVDLILKYYEQVFESTTQYIKLKYGISEQTDSHIIFYIQYSKYLFERLFFKNNMKKHPLQKVRWVWGTSQASPL